MQTKYKRILMVPEEVPNVFSDSQWAIVKVHNQATSSPVAPSLPRPLLLLYRVVSTSYGLLALSIAYKALPGLKWKNRFIVSE